MQVDFNGARRNLANAYNSVAVAINTDGTIDIEEEMEELRQTVATFLSMYDDDRGFRDMSDLADRLARVNCND